MDDFKQHRAIDHLKSYADQVNAGNKFLGDCDDYALTAAQLVVERGIAPADKVRLAICDTGLFRHMICLVEVEVDGKPTDYAIDNSHMWVYPAESLGYEWISTMRFSELHTWRDARGEM